MANVLFEQIWMVGNKVTGVKPRDELRPFFQLSYEEHLKKFESATPGGFEFSDSNFFSHSLYDSWKNGALCPAWLDEYLHGQ